ncbi:transcriptional regulator, TetR family [Lachnospiraceae bacterium NE2001]|nr:transcriptional regulator, TetR family [Lachnospiraceae bacterium NE2001]
MEKGNKKKRELQNALKMLAIEKGYANVTMKDIGEYVGLSVGGLYHHYHDVEEVFMDLIASETGDVWENFSNVKSFGELMDALDVYFEAEKKELLGQVPSVNTLMYEYYFSKPEAERVVIMKESHNAVVSEMTKILKKVYADKKLFQRMSEHICIVLQGLTNLSFSGCISKKIIEDEFAMLKIYLKNNYDTMKGEQY